MANIAHDISPHMMLIMKCDLLRGEQASGLCRGIISCPTLYLSATRLDSVVCGLVCEHVSIPPAQSKAQRKTQVHELTSTWATDHVFCEQYTRLSGLGPIANNERLRTSKISTQNTF